MRRICFVRGSARALVDEPFFTIGWNRSEDAAAGYKRRAVAADFEYAGFATS
jgi:hypothetical protein